MDTRDCLLHFIEARKNVLQGKGLMSNSYADTIKYHEDEIEKLKAERAKNLIEIESWDRFKAHIEKYEV